jgi:hypothetical protein
MTGDLDKKRLEVAGKLSFDLVNMIEHQIEGSYL